MYYLISFTFSGSVELSTQLIVAKPTVANFVEEEITKYAGESLLLTCEVNVDDNILETVTRKWSKDGEDIGEDLTTGENSDAVHISYLGTQSFKS